MLERGTFFRDYGSRQETVNLDDTGGIDACEINKLNDPFSLSWLCEVRSWCNM